MSRTMTGVSDSRTNKRLLLLALVLATLSAGLVYVTISRNSKESPGGTISDSAGATVPVVVAKGTVPARSIIRADQLEVRSYPAALVPQGAVSDPADLVGKAARVSLQPGEQFLDSKVVDLKPGERPEALSAVIPEGMRAMSIAVSQVVSAGGLILPGDYVDIIGSFSVKVGNEEVPDWFARTILENAQVLAVGQTIAAVPLAGEPTPVGTPAAGGKTEQTKTSSSSEATTMTLLVTPEQAAWLFLAERKGTLRAIVRSYGDGTVKTANIIPPTAAGSAGQPGYIYQSQFIPPGMPLPAP